MDVHKTILVLQEQRANVRTCKVSTKGVTVQAADESDADFQSRLRSHKVVNSSAEGVLTFKTNLELENDDIVAVQLKDRIAIGQVVRVDENVDLSYNGRLRWVVAKLNDAIEATNNLVKAEDAAIRKITHSQVYDQAEKYLNQKGVDSAAVANLIEGLK